MNYPAHFLSLVLACAAMMLSPALVQAQAQNNGTTGLTVGERVALPKAAKSANLAKSQNQNQTQGLSTLPELQIDGKTYLVADHRSTLDGIPLTLVIDPDGVVGQSFHEVVISGLPAATLQQKAAAVLAQAEAVKTYENMNMTVARYATLAQAAAALQHLRTALPGAEVGLPISFGLLRPQ